MLESMDVIVFARILALGVALTVGLQRLTRQVSRELPRVTYGGGGGVLGVIDGVFAPSRAQAQQELPHSHTRTAETPVRATSPSCNGATTARP